MQLQTAGSREKLATLADGLLVPDLEYDSTARAQAWRLHAKGREGCIVAVQPPPFGMQAGYMSHPRPLLLVRHTPKTSQEQQNIPHVAMLA